MSQRVARLQRPLLSSMLPGGMNPSAQQVQQDYERVAYPGKAHSQTHPDRLATMATLFGLAPAPVESCRVLEIGCTDGGNLIPMAYALPDAQFVGIDLCTSAIAEGTRVIASLGLKNVRLQELDLCAVPADFGSFDYIIAHGVFSWVPAEIRASLLDLCRAHLAPQGVAYISYNTYPGGYIRELVRNVMLYGTREIEEPANKRQLGTGLLQWIAEAQPEKDLYRELLTAEIAWMRKTSDATFHHDDLASTRTCFFFHEFASEAEEHGLQYLSEAAYFEMQVERFSPSVVQTLGQLALDRISREQYLDFLKCRRFRQSLLCHADLPVSEPDRNRIRKLFVSSAAKPSSPAPSLAEGAEEEFTAPGNASVRTGHALTKAALVHLAKVWPAIVGFDALLTAACELLESKADDASVEELGDSLLAMYAAPIVELHAFPGHFTLQPGERPCVSAIVRRELARGDRIVTNLRHASVRCDDELGRQSMQLLNGARTRKELVQELAAYCQKRGLALHKDGRPARTLAEIREILAAGVEENLRALARMSVLVPGN